MRLPRSVPAGRLRTARRAAAVALVTVAVGAAAAPPAGAAPPAAVVQAAADGSPVVLAGEAEIRFRGWAGAQLLVDCQALTGTSWRGTLYAPSGRRLPDTDGYTDAECRGAQRHKVFEALLLPEDGEYRLRFFEPVRWSTFWLSLLDTPAVPVTGPGEVELTPTGVGHNAALTFEARAGEHIVVRCLPWVADRVLLYGPDRQRVRSTPFLSDPDCRRTDHWDAPPTGTVVDATMPADGRYTLVFDYERDWTTATRVWFSRSAGAAPTR